MAEQNSDETKEFDPSQRKLDEARKSGDVPKSADLTSAAAQGGFLLALTAIGAASVERLGAALAQMLSDAARLSDRIFDGGTQAFAGATLIAVIGPVLPWFAIPALCAIAALAAQRGFAVSGDKLLPKLDRINPLRNAAQKFGANGLFEFAKSAVKLLVIALVLGLFLSGRLADLIRTAQQPDRLGMAVLVSTLLGFLTLSVLIAGAIGGIDLLWQRHSHNRKLRMSRKEMRDEHKSSEGDPHVKQQRRQKGYDIATNRMLTEVPKADVVIVNPTHFAVALKWERKPGHAPICTAKGVDEVAARIRAAAMEAGVPIRHDPPTARALYATIEIGREIHPDHYRTVAAAIRFAESLRAKARASGLPR
ncbi:EscU/YscU/HrcU family type III secretion system export apparatus switch protein [Frigidibacter sp. ROC022]|uniref:EscU/YscU/HrcU family type III secretion system export apparatus switch protein n=1 Tax=Frigidibacter sp. ROC022 TaxID=2971796 RepID=UPI00215B0C4C|nr:flagellar type III secretion system protein FlhB [Frigidibacter sp. ROC022]MCR8724361.1 flagellar type III secretion system protein FlhB [Frigidibacter sp. ROC022]